MRQVKNLLVCLLFFVASFAAQQKPQLPKAIECLAQGIYFEAGNQSAKGKEAVAWVIFNRSKEWNLSVCDVVHQKLGGKCQFVWYCDGKSNTLPNNKNAIESQRLAKDMLENPEKYTDFTNGAKFFHATYVKPGWKNHRKFTIKVGGHLFYR